MPETIDSDQCAELLRCTAGQVEEMARAGELPGLKIGRAWLFVRHDLLAFLAEKARDEAQARRSKRSPSAQAPQVKSRRRAAPVLPSLVRS